MINSIQPGNQNGCQQHFGAISNSILQDGFKIIGLDVAALDKFGKLAEQAAENELYHVDYCKDFHRSMGVFNNAGKQVSPMMFTCPSSADKFLHAVTQLREHADVVLANTETAEILRQMQTETTKIVKQMQEKILRYGKTFDKK